MGVQHDDIDHSGLTGVGGSLTVQDEGTPLATAATTLNFVGAGVTASGTAATKTITIPGAATGAYDINYYTGGDITLNNTSMTAVPGLTDLAVAASTGDLILAGLAVRPTTTTGASIAFDFVTMPGGTATNFLFANGTAALTTGNPGWYIGSGETSGAHGAFPYVVQASDIASGTVTLRLYFRTSASRAVEADANVPLVTWVKNLAQ